jgi:RNA 2',3'-cyclic 3'-phosphodiesterase
VKEGGLVRSFVAIPSDPMWVESTRGLLERLRNSLPEASWTRPESWHLTLRFLGEVPSEALLRFSSAVEPIAANTVPGEIQSEGAAVFPARGPARVLGVGFARSEILDGISRLAETAEKEARLIGAEDIRRPFHPHVTLGRIRRPWPPEAVESFRREVASWSFPVWQARACVLFESLLAPEGAVHKPLYEWSLAGGDRGVRA